LREATRFESAAVVPPYWFVVAVYVRKTKGKPETRIDGETD
jgi:hypothetical protein